MIGEAAYTFMAADAGITASATPAPQVYPQVMPADEPGPAITYSIDSEDDGQALDRISSLKEATIEVNCWSTSYLTVNAMASAVYDAFCPESGGVRAGYAGAFGDYTTDHIRREAYFELFESDTRFHRISQRFLVAYY